MKIFTQNSYIPVITRPDSNKKNRPLGFSSIYLNAVVRWKKYRLMVNILTFAFVWYLTHILHCTVLLQIGSCINSKNKYLAIFNILWKICEIEALMVESLDKDFYAILLLSIFSWFSKKSHRENRVFVHCEHTYMHISMSLAKPKACWLKSRTICLGHGQNL